MLEPSRERRRPATLVPARSAKRRRLPRSPRPARPRRLAIRRALEYGTVLRSERTARARPCGSASSARATSAAALTRRLTALGHEVSVANSRGPREPDGAGRRDRRRRSRCGGSAGRRDRGGHHPDEERAGPAQDLFAACPASVVVVDTGNYYPQQRDGRIAGIENGLTESRWVAQQLGRPVIKAFNNIYAKRLQETAGPRAPRTASPCRSRATTRAPRPR